MSMIGKTLAHYEITSQLGKGGMGEVYQAKDRKLGRDVAIKVLPEEFAKDTDRVARFQREAKLLASLNHPNIAAIYGLEESGGTNFLVLELVEGETLADQLKRGPIPVEESLKLALQIAEALEAAHEKGVIHRDLKPANIKVTPEGKVKVLDFGLAKAFAGDQEVNLSNSPTLSNAATQQGVILGTAAYMSPEQARGKTIDKRTDIWAFGCVLYEMLTGQAAFQGEDVTEILAAVVKGGLNLDLLPAKIHPRVRELLSRCLQKDIRKRYFRIADARYEIEQALADPSGVFVQPTTEAEPRAGTRTILPWVAAALVLGAIIAGVAAWKLKPSEPRQVMRFEYELPEGQELSDLTFPVLAVSPDGKQFVYSTHKGLYLRSMEELTAKLISGTEGSAQQPFFSPDGKWIGYFSAADRKLKKIAINGGAPVVLCDVAQLLGADWSTDNTIVYGQLTGDIMRISANGGTPESLVKTKSGLLFLPQILPDKKSVLYSSAGGTTPEGIMVQSLKSGETKKLCAGIGIRCLSTGHLLYGWPNNNNLFAVPFDLDRLEVTGGQVPMVEGVAIGVRCAISDSGTLVYVPGTATFLASGQRTLVWVDRKGKEEPITAAPNNYLAPRISPDGKRVALQVSSGSNGDIWIWDLDRENLMRLTFNEDSHNPIWTLDGQRIVFESDVRQNPALYWKAADGTGETERLSSAQKGRLAPSAWSSDGKILVLTEWGQGRASVLFDIETLSMGRDRKRMPLLEEKYSETHPSISHDGRWMAYCSDESGQSEVYVRPFPDVSRGRWQVSTGGGSAPLWSPDGRELFYRKGDAVMAVLIETTPTFKPGKPAALFQGKYDDLSSRDRPSWDISPDGKHFLMMKSVQTTGGATIVGGVTAAQAPRKIIIVLNWLEELKQRVPGHVQ
jgi:serine/threonine protein kinase/Tol biopolymer transport system component